MNRPTPNTQPPAASFTPTHWLLCGLGTEDLPAPVRESALFRWRAQCGLVQTVEADALAPAVAQWLLAQPQGRVAVLLRTGDPAQRLTALRCAPDPASAERVGVCWLRGNDADAEVLWGLLAQPDVDAADQWLTGPGAVQVPEPLGDWPEGATALWTQGFQAWAEDALDTAAAAFDDPADGLRHALALYGFDPAPQAGAEDLPPPIWQAAGRFPTSTTLQAMGVRATDATSASPATNGLAIPIEGHQVMLTVRPEWIWVDGLKSMSKLHLAVQAWSDLVDGNLLQLELYSGVELPLLLRPHRDADLSWTLYLGDMPDLADRYLQWQQAGATAVARVSVPA